MNTDTSKHSSDHRPHGFDPGLRCLAGVFVWTMAVKFFLPAAVHTHNRAWVLLAMLSDFIGLAILLLISMIVWFRRKEAICPPRSWALLIAIIWASSSLAAWVWISGAANRPGQTSQTPMLSTAFQNDGHEIDRKTFSVSLPDHWTEDTKDDMYNPDSFIFFEGPESTVFTVIIGQKSAGASADTLVAKQRDSFSKKFTDATTTEITAWSGYDGKGFIIEGKIQGILNERVTIFGFETGDNACVIEESATPNDYNRYASDFDQLRQTFKLK